MSDSTRHARQEHDRLWASLDHVSRSFAADRDYRPPDLLPWQLARLSTQARNRRASHYPAQCITIPENWKWGRRDGNWLLRSDTQEVWPSENLKGDPGASVSLVPASRFHYSVRLCPIRVILAVMFVGEGARGGLRRVDIKAGRGYLHDNLRDWDWVDPWGDGMIHAYRERDNMYGVDQHGNVQMYYRERGNTCMDTSPFVEFARQAGFLDGAGH